jgi:hypothetical protein
LGLAVYSNVKKDNQVIRLISGHFWPPEGRGAPGPCSW